ncbi:hypothetical protein B0H19DRAFT_1374247 [Mycena capillaripes]|nr:hypothetical protein B0H19DRAFT_1374247 [Mycena capillaripes]
MALSESKICEFAFTHLERVWIENGNALSEPMVMALRQLLSLPTVRRLHLGCVSSKREDFIRLRNHSSSGIRHLELSCQERRWTTSPDPPSALGTPIALDSLYMASTDALDYRLLQAPPPFDLSHLKVLGVGWRTQVPWESFGPSVRSIETLNIVMNSTVNTLDLSSFPNLSFLRIYLPHWIHAARRLSMVAQLLSKIGPANMIRKVTISADPEILDGALCQLLDTSLSSLPIPNAPIVEFEIDSPSYEGVGPFLLRLSSRNLNFIILKNIDGAFDECEAHVQLNADGFVVEHTHP